MAAEIAPLLRNTNVGVPERLKFIVTNNRFSNAIPQNIAANSDHVILNHNVELFKYILSLDLHSEQQIVLF